MHSLEIKEQIKRRRLEGISSELIAKEFSIAKGTVYAWTRNLVLSSDAKKRLLSNSMEGRRRGSITTQNYSKAIEKSIQDVVQSELQDIKLGSITGKLLCSFLFWAEGAKTKLHVNFTNSDPQMIHIFLHLLRKNFLLDEKKFRVVVHIHSYHDPIKIQSFWSQVTGIPLSQFNKPYCKSESGMNKKNGYMGCVSLRYYDAKIAKELFWLYTTLVEGVSVNW